MTPPADELLAAIAREHGTPCYVLDLDLVRDRVREVREIERATSLGVGLIVLDDPAEAERWALAVRRRQTIGELLVAELD